MSLSSRCEVCGAPLEEGAICPRCQPVGLDRDSPSPSAGQRNPWAFSLAELLLGTTYVCILLGVTLPFPEWGIFLWILSAVALARTIWLSVAWKRAGKPFTALAQIGSYAESLLVGVLVSAAACVAFLGVCFPLGAPFFQCCATNTDAFMGGAFALGGIAGLASGGYLLWVLWIRDFVRWFWRQEPPTMLARGVALANSVILLSSILLGSAAAAAVGGLAWLVATAEEYRDSRSGRIGLFFCLLAGYVVGAAGGIIAGRAMARVGRQWFLPLLIVALLLLAGFSLTYAVDALTSNGDSAIFTLPVIGVLLSLIAGMVLNRILPPPAGGK